VAKPVRVHAGNTRGAARAAHDLAGRVPVQRASMAGGQPLVRADVLQVAGGPGGGQRDQVRVQRHVPVVAQLAGRDPQPVPRAGLHDRVRVQAGQLPGPHTGAGQQPGNEPVPGEPALARAAAISLAASRPPGGNFGSGPGFGGMSPAMTGLRAGAPGQCHSMIRPENWRMARIRCRRVFLLITWPAGRRRPASHTL
jgi:hypothetical protein